MGELILTITNGFQDDFGIPHPFMWGNKVCIPSCNLKTIFGKSRKALYIRC